MLERSWLGRRVTLRRVVDRNSEGRVLFGDVLGDLVALNADTARLRTRTDVVDVRLAHVVAARLALPSTAEELSLEATAARGWRPEQTGQVGGWLLRAAGGFSARANSVLPLRGPGLRLDDAVAKARDWYAERGLPLRIQVPLDARRLLDAGLAERGWPSDPDVDVLAVRLDAVPDGLRAAEPPVEVVPSPDEEWFARYRDGAATATAARALLTRHDRAGFASIRRDGRIVAIGRGAVDDGWLGVTAVEVAPELRRQGLAGALVRALWRWGDSAGAERSYVQVSSDNPAAVALYQHLGYWPHHRYRVRKEPAG